MEFKNIRSKVQLLIIFFSISLFSIAQIKENDKSLLLGEWVNEEVSIYDAGNTIYLDPGNSYIKTYAQINIKKDTIVLLNTILSGLEEIQKVKYETEGNYLGFDLPSGESFIAEWIIIEDKLYLEFNTFYSPSSSGKVDVLLVYKRK